ncbi:alpha/beta fold hydrolase [Rhodococcus sp. UNC23MFCrub1.1]|uniref:alpha/beta fold hydrolase n=1 Tax=Rhodococcus sp. UNC23MFCrub1.1 TaxID=1449068 RepID=UPI0004837F86|nr:alpha/beta fold hydrolase [Rhodococcus sp. UNC23MFCrub1.1]
MSTTPTWFGSDGRRLFGVVHLPEGDHARAGIVLCPSMGKEHVDTYRGLKLLAQELAAAGFAVLRFDYLGVGDSGGDQNDAAAMDGWLASIGDAVSLVRSLGCTTVSAVGLRAGALLLDRAADAVGPLHTVVLWDPVPRGRAYLREQQALYRLGVGADTVGTDTDDTDLHTIGHSLSTEAAAALSALELTAASPAVSQWIFALRDGYSSPRLDKAIERSGATVRHVGTMTEFVTPESFLVPLPNTAIRAVVDILDGAHDSARDCAVEFTPTTSVTHQASDGSTFTEHIESIGAHGLFGIRSTPVGTPDSAPTLVFCATANDTRTGPARLWVELAREAARSGASALRFDRRGTGESEVVRADEHTPIYSAESADDVVAAARAAHADPRRVVLTGICSGSWNAAHAATEIGAGGAVMVNAIAWSWKRKKSTQGEIDPADLGIPRSDPAWQKTPRARIKNALQTHLPYRAWRLLGVRGVTQVPEVILRSLADNDVDATVILAPADHRWFVDQRGPEGLTRIQRRSGTVPLIVSAPVGDHSAYHADMRRTIISSVLARTIEPQRQQVTA